MESLEPQNAPVPQPAPVEPLVIRARGTGFFGVLMTTILFGLFVVFILSSPENRGLNGILIICALVYFEVMIVKAWLFPPRLSISGDVFEFRNPGKVRTPLSNVADFMLFGGVLIVRFHQLEAVEVGSESLRRRMLQSGTRVGYHLQVPGFRFTVDQVNEVRSRLGLPMQMVDRTWLAIADFHQRLAELTPRPIFTYGLIGACVAVAAAMWYQAPSSFLEPSVDLLIEWGANYGPKTLRGEWWRLFSHQFVHVGAIHLLFNMWVLWNIGPLLERMVGSVTFLLGYLISGLAGGIASLWWNSGHTSAGASGALFGLIGILLGVLIRNRRIIPKELLQQEMRFAVMFVVLNIGLTFSLKQIDHSAHLGGLAGGVFFGLLIQPAFTSRSIISRSIRLVLATAVCCGIAALLYQKIPVHSDVRVAISADQKIAPRFYEIVRKLKADELSGPEAARQIREEVVAPWQKAREEFEADGDLAPEDHGRREVFLKFLRLREQSFEVFADSLDKGDIQGRWRANQLTEEAFNTIEEWNQANPGQSEFTIQKIPQENSKEK